MSCKISSNLGHFELTIFAFSVEVISFITSNLGAPSFEKVFPSVDGISFLVKLFVIFPMTVFDKFNLLS